MPNEQLFPTTWETQKTLLNDFYNFGKAEVTVVFFSMWLDYHKSLPPEVAEKYTEIFTKVKEILGEAKAHCKLTLE